ncbi:hypothetical protein JW898_05755 [Candidatus Woesearchaeota archaeon]|nr:hypothetical protein [Candidatus Woesearchaeota archaeon]
MTDTIKNPIADRKNHTIDTAVLSTLNEIEAHMHHTEGADPTPYIIKVAAKRRIYTETIRMLCESYGKDPMVYISLFDRQLDHLLQIYASERAAHEAEDALPDLTA